MLSTSAAVMMAIPAVPANPYRLAWARLLRLPRLLTENIRSPCSRRRAAREGEKLSRQSVGPLAEVRTASLRQKSRSPKFGKRQRRKRAARRSSESVGGAKEPLAEVQKTSAKKKSRSPSLGKRQRRKRAARRSLENVGEEKEPLAEVRKDSHRRAGVPSVPSVASGKGPRRFDSSESHEKKQDKQ